MSDPMRDFAAHDARPPMRWHWVLCVLLVLIAVAASIL